MILTFSASSSVVPALTLVGVLTRIIHVFRDKESLQVLQSRYRRSLQHKEAFTCHKIPRYSVYCSLDYLRSWWWRSSTSGRVARMEERSCCGLQTDSWG